MRLAQSLAIGAAALSLAAGSALAADGMDDSAYSAQHEVLVIEAMPLGAFDEPQEDKSLEPGLGIDDSISSPQAESVPLGAFDEPQEDKSLEPFAVSYYDVYGIDEDRDGVTDGYLLIEESDTLG